MDSKTNMKQFVQYLSIGIWGMATCATAAHIWNTGDNVLASIAAGVSVLGIIIGVVYFINKAAKETEKNK